MFEIKPNWNELARLEISQANMIFGAKSIGSIDNIRDNHQIASEK